MGYITSAEILSTSRDDIDALPDHLIGKLFGAIASSVGVAELVVVLAFRIAKGVQTATSGNFPGCARAASGHAAAPPSATISSRRPIVTGMWPSP